VAAERWRRDMALVVPNYFTAAMMVVASDLLSAMPRRPLSASAPCCWCRS